jgi:hypothetical protein
MTFSGRLEDGEFVIVEPLDEQFDTPRSWTHTFGHAYDTGEVRATTTPIRP